MRFFEKNRPVVDAMDPVPVAATGTYDGAPYAGYDVPRASDLTVGDYANGIPNIKLGAMMRSLVRQGLWVVPLFILGVPVAMYLTKDFKQQYSGEGSIMVQLGDEYVYQPVGGTNTNASLVQTPDTITLNEVAIIKNTEVMDAVLGPMLCNGALLRRYAPDTARKLGDRACDPSFAEVASLEQKLAYMDLRKQMDKEFFVAARPKSSVIDLAYKHEDPQLAVSMLNALIASYETYRKDVFVAGASDLIAQRRQDTEEQLRQIDREISAFLSKNGISDFDSEQKGAAKRTEDLKASLNAERARIAETERALAVVEDQLRGVPDTINLYVDDRASNRIAQAELELKQLLAKYLPTSDPVRQKQLELDELKSLVAANNGRATGGRRVGPNPVFQTLLTRRNTLQATANSLREKEFTLQRQLDSVDGKLARLTKLSPAFSDLIRERDTLTERLKTYQSKEQEALINQSQVEATAENVRVLSEATYPIKGRDTGKLAFAFAMLAWGFTLFMLALFRVFADPRLYATPPGARTALRRPEPAQDVAPMHDPIPEPVQPYAPAAPVVQPTPDEYAPAAYAEPQPPYDQPQVEQPENAQPAQEWHAQEWQPEPAQAQSYAPPAVDAYGNPLVPVTYADGTVAWEPAYAVQPQPEQAPVVMENPYLAGASAAPIAPQGY